MSIVPALGVTLERHYAATPERVYRAWTVAEDLVRWFNPNPADQCLWAEVDLRQGGQYRIAVPTPNGTRIVSGTYLELAPPHRLVFTWLWDGHDESKLTTVTVLLKASAAGGCDMVLRHEGFPDDNMSQAHGKGWDAVLARLENEFVQHP